MGSPDLVFGMNFQAVSVGQKLAKDNSDGSCTDDTGSLNGQPGGYKDGAGTPTDVLAYALQQTDEALGDIVQALKSRASTNQLCSLLLPNMGSRRSIR